MLSHLLIHNFAIIEEEEIHLSSGFTVFTGETGAGKSIILDAIILILGGRASADMVRRGESKASVKGTFNLSSDERLYIEDRLKTYKIKARPDGRLKVLREVSLTGKNRTRVNGQSFKVSDLRSLTEGLIEIVRQHESYQLLDPEQHLHILDAFGSDPQARQALEIEVDHWIQLKAEQTHLKRTHLERERRVHQLQSQIARVEQLSLMPGEDEQVDRDLRLLHAAETLRVWVDEGVHTIYERSPSLLDQIDDLSRGLERLTSIDERLEGFYEALSRVRLELDELTHDLRRFHGELPIDQETLSELEERRAQLEKIKEEYGVSIEDVLHTIEQDRKEYQVLINLDSRQLIADIEANETLKNATILAQEVSARRIQFSDRLSALVEHELKNLGMAQCQFKVRFEEVSLNRFGLDAVEFLISPNPGEGFKPLARIASGGELSRLTLALKVVLMHSDETSTYVFDEVDSGIGGGIAEGVGLKLKRIAQNRQVICITHLPQVASCADHHLKIEKVLLSDRTFSSVRSLSVDERVDELARMLGGQDITEATLAHATEMIERGQHLPASLSVSFDQSFTSPERIRAFKR